MPERDPSVCVNCGQPPAFQTATTAANVDYYCADCAERAYPGAGRGLLVDTTTKPAGLAAFEEADFPSAAGPTVMRGGEEVADPRLGRVAEFDERSRSFPMAEILEEAPKEYKPRSYTWGCEQYFDQGSEGSCVGHAWAHEMVCRPVVIEDIDQPFARWVYKTAQRYDAWAGEAYEGTSVLAGAKVLQKRPPAMPEGRGLMLEYRWIFGDMNEVIKTLGYFGPIVLGCNWYAGMMKTDANGLIKATGSYMGGHAVLLKGVSVKQKAVRGHQSWGTDWGQDGDFWLSFADLERLLGERGELCVPVHRKEWG